MNVYYQRPSPHWGEPCRVTSESEQHTILSTWDGFIAPDGVFYGTRPTGAQMWNGVEDCHEVFAAYHCTDFPSVEEDYKTELIRAGWAACTFGVRVGLTLVPCTDIVCHAPTPSQLTTIRHILALRHLSPSDVKGSVLHG